MGERKRKEASYMQDLRNVSGRLEGCACSYGTSSMGLTSKTSHIRTPNHTNINISVDGLWWWKVIFCCCAKDNTQFRAWVAWCDTTEYPVSSSPSVSSRCGFVERQAVTQVLRAGAWIFPALSSSAHFAGYLALYKRTSFGQGDLFPWRSL